MSHQNLEPDVFNTSNINNASNSNTNNNNSVANKDGTCYFELSNAIISNPN